MFNYGAKATLHVCFCERRWLFQSHYLQLFKLVTLHGYSYIIQLLQIPYQWPRPLARCSVTNSVNVWRFHIVPAHVCLTWNTVCVLCAHHSSFHEQIAVNSEAQWAVWLFSLPGSLILSHFVFYTSTKKIMNVSNCVIQPLHPSFFRMIKGLTNGLTHFNTHGSLQWQRVDGAKEARWSPVVSVGYGNP